MPNIKSQEKRDRQNIKRRIKNRGLKTRIKTDLKRLAEAVKSKNREDAEKSFNILSKDLDKAVKGSAVHKNFSSNKKSKAAKQVNSIKKS
ncbi:MAG TPA: 30S ribosomal protein S20 [Candidatus Humimicrobiaceae bacterium]